MRRRRNPFDAKALVAARAPVGVVLTLSALEDAGVPVRQWGDYTLVDYEAAERAGMYRALTDAAQASGGLVMLVSSGAMAASRSKLAKLTKEIERAMTRTFFVTGWSSHHDYQGREDPFEVAPKRMPADVRAFTTKYIKKLEAANGLPVAVLFEVAAQAPGKHYVGPTTADFGHYVAMEAVGHGVAWTDDHPDIGMKVPDGEWYY